MNHLNSRWFDAMKPSGNLTLRELENDQNLATIELPEDIYHLVMTNSLPLKDPPFFRTVNHLFL